MQTIFKSALAVLGAATCFGCATNPVTGKQDLVLMSEAQPGETIKVVE